MILNRLLLTCLLLLMSGCHRKQNLSLPISPSAGNEYFYLAQQKGFTTALGLDLKQPEFSEGTDVVEAYIRGQTPLVSLTLEEVEQICGQVPKRCPTVVLVIDESRGADVLLARSGITGIAELRGKEIALSRSSHGLLLLGRALEQEGFGFAQLNLRLLSGEALLASVAEGTTAAAVVGNPGQVRRLQQLGMEALLDSSRFPQEMFRVLAVEPGFLVQHRSALQNLILAWRQAHRWSRLHHDQACAVMATRAGHTRELFMEEERGLNYPDLVAQRKLLGRGGAVELSLWKSRDLLQGLGQLQADAPLPRLDPTLVEEVLRSHPEPSVETAPPVSPGKHR